ncbi:MAG: sugar kinase [bacterium]|nr:sugar kinase [bacterium]
MAVTIIGTVALDTIKTPSESHSRILGGSATYAGIAASIFDNISLAGIVGNDFPDSYLTFFESRGIDITGIDISEGKTFHWNGYYEKDMSQAYTVQTDLNALLEFDPDLPEKARQARVVFLANIDPVLQKKTIEQLKRTEVVILDTMNFWIENSLDALKSTLELVDILIINDQEIRMLTGKDNIIQGMSDILELGPSRLIVKKGEHGSIMFNGQDYFICPAFPLKELVDPTGAGDSFAGGFAGYLSQSKVLDEETYKQAIIAGTMISSFTVQGFSMDVLKNIDKDRILRRYKEFEKFTALPDKLVL